MCAVRLFFPEPRLSEREMSAPVPPITSTPLAPASPTPAADVASRPQWIAPPPPSGVVPADRTEKIVGFRKTMVQTMTAANAVPTFGFSDEVNMNALVRYVSCFLPALVCSQANLWRCACSSVCQFSMVCTSAACFALINMGVFKSVALSS